MTPQEIITRLTLIYPSDVLYEITMETVIFAMVRRMWEEALGLSVEELELAGAEVRAAIEHHPDERAYIDIGLDAWEIVRNL